VVIVVVVAVVAATVVVTTGHARQLATLPVRAVRLLVAAAVVQVGTAVLLPGSGTARSVALVLSVLLVALFLAGNARLPGVPLVAAGLLCNAVVVGANAAMPVSLDAAARAGVATSALDLDADPLREPLTEGTRLALLADRVAVPAPGWPQVISVGDVLAAAGVGLLLIAGSVPPEPQPRPAARRRAQPVRVDRRTASARESTTRGSYS
jgi:hypothetical protein